jgi:putative oxidoreductase
LLNRWLNPYAHWANFMLRCFVGLIFLAHSMPKLFGAFGGSGLDDTANLLQQYGFQDGYTWAMVLGIVELLGGIALIVGLFTRYAALLLAVVMAVAIGTVHLPNGFFLPNGIEFALALLAANLALLVGGPGALAVDGWLARHGVFAIHKRERTVTGRAA